MTGRPLVICSKSTWAPAIRREHALARMAAARGHPVTFVERPRDIRRARGAANLRRWAAGFVGRDVTSVDGVVVVPTSVPAPGHHDDASERLEVRLLGARLRSLDMGPAAVVATVPWRWAACRSAPAHRRVFDCADDWSDLLPARRARMTDLYRRIGAEADEVVVVREELGDLFGDRPVHVVGNGVTKELLDTPPTSRSRPGTMVYTGTFTARFDADLVAATLALLPEWRIELYGQCQYPGAGERPGGDLARLIARFPDRAVWHGVVPRSRLPHVLDEAAVLVLPHRPNTAFGGRRGWGGDVMKLYDYAARGRPIVSTRWDDDIAATGPPGIAVVEGDPAVFADALVAAVADPEHGEPAEAMSDARRAWAAKHSWDARWRSWSCHVFGC